MRTNFKGNKEPARQNGVEKESSELRFQSEIQENRTFN